MAASRSVSLLEPSSTSAEKFPEKSTIAGSGKVSNGNMVTRQEMSSPRKDVTCRTHHSPKRNMASSQNSSSPNNRRTTCTQSSYKTLHVDVDLANRRFGTVSPGRRCLSDSKLTVGKQQKNIPASAASKRKLDLSPVSPTKRRRLEIGATCSLSTPTSPSLQKDLSNRPMDCNQNFQDISEFVNSRTSTANQGTEYKSEHSIGHRRACVQISTLSEAVLSSPWKALSNPQLQSSSVTLMSHKVEVEGGRGIQFFTDSKQKTLDCEYEAHLHAPASTDKRTCTCNADKAIKKKALDLKYLVHVRAPTSTCKQNADKVTTPSTPDSLSEDISDKFLKVDNDILFKKEAAIPISVYTIVTDRDGEKRQTQCQDTKVTLDSPLSETSIVARGKEISLDLHTKQTQSDSYEDECSVFTEDSNTTDDSGSKEGTGTKTKKQRVKKNWHDVQPRAPRKRRIASLTAETKVHLLYEKDDVEMPKKAATVKTVNANKVSDAVFLDTDPQGDHPLSPKACTDMTPFTFCKHLTVTQTGASVPCADCVQLYYSLSLKQVQEQNRPLKSPLGDQICRVCGLRKCICLTCAESVRTTQSVFSPTNEQDRVVHKMEQSPKSAPAVCPSKRPTLVPTSMRRATVDTAECQKLTSFLKNPPMIRLSRHSTDMESAPNDMPGLVDETLEQLTLLQTGGLMIPSLLDPPTLQPQLHVLPTNHLATKSRIPKILNPANLKPNKTGRRKSTNGWRGVGEPELGPVVVINDAFREYRYCYESIRRKEDDIRTLDCVLLRASANRRKEPAYVAKVASLWEDPDSGDLMMSLLWYYQPEHTEAGRLPHHLEQELFACRHWDINSVACIEDKCYVLTPAEYSRYRANLQRQMEAVIPGRPCVPENPDSYPRASRLPPDDVSPGNVFFCRQVYDFRQKRLLKNPS